MSFHDNDDELADEKVEEPRNSTQRTLTSIIIIIHLQSFHTHFFNPPHAHSHPYGIWRYNETLLTPTPARPVNNGPREKLVSRIGSDWVSHGQKPSDQWGAKIVFVVVYKYMNTYLSSPFIEKQEVFVRSFARSSFSLLEKVDSRTMLYRTVDYSVLCTLYTCMDWTSYKTYSRKRKRERDNPRIMHEAANEFFQSHKT